MDDTEIDLRSILSLLRRRLRIILCTAAVVMVIGITLIFALTPIYSASALILVDPSSKNLLSPEAQTSSGSDSARIDSEVEILRSDNILLKVIAAEGLVSDPNMGPSLNWGEQLIALLRLGQTSLPTGNEALNQTLTNLREAVSIQRRGLTYLIAVQARSEDRQQAASLANAIAQAYIEDQLASKIESTLASRDILQARITEAREAIVTSEHRLDGFIDSNVDRLAADSGQPDLARLQQQIEQLDQTRNENDRLASVIQASLAQSDWQTIVSSTASTALSELNRQRSMLAEQLDRAATDSQAAMDLQRQLADLGNSLRDTALAELTNIRDQIAADQERIAMMRQDLRNTVLASALSADVLTELYGLQQNAALARSQYQTILARSHDLETQARLQVADSRIVSPALAPEKPSSPNALLILSVSAALAVAIGVASAFLREHVIGGFISDAQLSSILKSRVASGIPRQKLPLDNDSLADLMVTAPLSMFSESVRRLRATLEQTLRSLEPASPDEACNIIMVASTAPNEGKTTVALALARSYALAGRSTLLIDCDLRKPSLHRHLGFESSMGLLEFLSAKNASNLSEIISRDTISPATIIVGAHRSDLPTDQLLTGASFARLMRAARLTFDVVIVDTPPVGPVVDSLYIAPFADAIVFVTRWAHTAQLDAKQALASLMTSKRPATEVVTIINQQDLSDTSYMRKYGSYYADVA